jgi:hypothetical protein
MGLGAGAHVESVTHHTIHISIKDERVSLVLVGRDSIERTEQTDAGLDADNPSGE